MTYDCGIWLLCLSGFVLVLGLFGALSHGASALSRYDSEPEGRGR